jgi:monoamine oxidase
VDLSDIDVVIIGAGLCGLATALLLQEGGKSVRILEAGPVGGGRIRSLRDPQGAFLADLGPTWVWPEYQPTIVDWIERLDLETFPQFTTGETIMDFGPDQVPRRGSVPAQDGNERLKGGSTAMIDALLARLSPGTLICETRVEAVQANDQGLIIQTGNPRHSSFYARMAIIALPPRIAATTIDWKEALPPPVLEALLQTPTWMAPHAKVAILYERAFWRAENLSGRIMSRSGPLVETHDHTSDDGNSAALWGFIGWPNAKRRQVGENLEPVIREQLKRCFGASAPDPLSVHIEDWAENGLIANASDLEGPAGHPEIRPEILRRAHLNKNVYFAGSETATRSPGLIEGALHSAERVVGQVLGEGQVRST